MSKEKKVTKKDMLEYYITDFATSVMGDRPIKKTWNPAWHKMWRRISKLKIV
jgi:hypothetical protein